MESDKKKMSKRLGTKETFQSIPTMGMKIGENGMGLKGWYLARKRGGEVKGDFLVGNSVDLNDRLQHVTDDRLTSNVATDDQ